MRLCTPPGRAVVALGKFEALHLGHQQLAYRAVKNVEEDEDGGESRLSCAFLLRLRGVHAALRDAREPMAPPSPFAPVMPLVASEDRPRVLGEWTRTLADPRYRGDAAARVPLHECALKFSTLRHLSPRSFVIDVLHQQLGAGAVVVGPDFRFGYKAEGDVEMLMSLCAELSIRVNVVDVLTTCALPPEEENASNGPMSRVSSTRITESVQVGDMTTTRALLGRKYRLIAKQWKTTTRSSDAATSNARRRQSLLRVEPHAICNMLPRPGQYECIVLLFTPPSSSTPDGGCGGDGEQRIVKPTDTSTASFNDEEGSRCTVAIDSSGCLDLLDVSDDDAGMRFVQRLQRRGDGAQMLHLAIDFL